MKRISTNKAPAAVGPYVHGTITKDGLLYTSGQVALTPSGELITSSIEDETRQVMDNLTAILDVAGCRMSDVLKTTIYITDPTSYRTVNQIYEGYFQDGQYPARECVGAAFLPLPDARVEISMIAELPH